MSCNGSHLGIPINIKNTKFVKNLPMIDAQTWSKGHVSFCHHLTSVIWYLFTFESSPLKPLGQMSKNLVGGIYGMSCINIVNFVPIRKQAWIPDDRCQVMAKAHMAFRPSYLIKRFKLENLEELGR
jgi:hypothetical protein